MSCDPGKCTVAHGYEDFWGGFIEREDAVKTTRDAASEARRWIRGKFGPNLPEGT